MVIEEHIKHFHVLYMYRIISRIGNIMILRAISANKELQTATNLFLASLAVTDLLITMFLPLYAVSIIHGLLKKYLHTTNNYFTYRSIQ